MECNNSNIGNSNKSNSHKGNISDSQLLHPGTASVLLKVSLQTLRRWYRENKLDAVRTLGGQLRIPKSEVERILGHYAPVEDIPLESYMGFDDDDIEEQKESPNSYLASLFQPPADPMDAEIERDKIFGYTSRNANNSGSLIP